MVKFRVKIPAEALATYDNDPSIQARILTAINAETMMPLFGCQFGFGTGGNYEDILVEGKAPSQVVAILAAMAQGHPIDALLEATGV